MKRILLVYLPFCTPASPPYSITNLYSFLKANCNEQVDVLDLNLLFHKLKFPDYQKYYQDSSQWADYDSRTVEYKRVTARTYSENNKRVVAGKKPEFFGIVLQKILDKKPDIVAFSIVYSSQAFYASALLREMKKTRPDLITVMGGPAVNEKLRALADHYLSNELQLLQLLMGKEIGHDALQQIVAPDFSVYSLQDYFTPYPVIPVRTSTTCYYQQCTFCSHYNKTKYSEFPLEVIRETIINSKQKYFFFIDDMIPRQRLLDLAAILQPLQVTWACQLRPTRDMDAAALQQLKKSGLSFIMWGVESGNDRILQLMKKGTNTNDIVQVLSNSHAAGIKNIAFVLFGFPTETKEEFLDTVQFLKKNEQNLDLLSLSVFGLQKGTPVYTHSELFGVTKITERERTVLEPTILYEVQGGLTQEQASMLKKKYAKTFASINKYPKAMNFFREHMVCVR